MLLVHHPAPWSPWSPWSTLIHLGPQFWECGYTKWTKQDQGGPGVVQGHRQDHGAGWWSRSVQDHRGPLKNFFLIELLETFSVITSFPDVSHHCLKDHNGNILAYHFCYPDHLLKKLKESQYLHPAGKMNDIIRSNFHHCHYALWADYSPEIMQSKEYRDDCPALQAWLNPNKELFEYISHNL